MLMQAIALEKPFSLRLVTQDVPRTPSDGVLLKTKCVSICSTDISYFRGHLYPSQYPVVLGHEYVGEVIDVGPETEDISIGDRLVYFGQSDFGGLAEFRAIRPILPGQKKAATFLTDRFFLDDERAAAVILPPKLSNRCAPLIEPITAVLRAILTHPPKIGDRICILGAGPCGIIAGSIIRKFHSVRSIAILDKNFIRLKIAQELFADHCAEILAEPQMAAQCEPFDYIFDALPPLIGLSDDDDPRRWAKRMAAPGSKYVLYGASQVLQKFDTWLILAKGITVCSAPFDVSIFPMHKTAYVMKTALSCVVAGIVDPNKIMTHNIKFHQTDLLIDFFERYSETGALKTVIQFEI